MLNIYVKHKNAASDVITIKLYFAMTVLFFIISTVINQCD